MIVKHRIARLLLIMAFAMHAGTASAQESPYLTAEPLPKLALLVGMESYGSLGDLPSVSLDVAAMYEALDKLAFTDIMVVTNPCLLTIHEALEEFTQRVRLLAPDGGATVMVFFAGHGGMLKHDQYVLPVEFKLSALADHEHHELALPTSLVEDAITQANAGAGVLMLDMCRNSLDSAGAPAVAGDVQVAGELQTDTACANATATWRKTSTAPPVASIGFAQPVGSRLITAYSTRPGAKVLTDADTVSPYVAALVAELNSEQPIVPNLFSSVYQNLVSMAPDIRLKGLGHAYLRADAKDLDVQKSSWTKALTVANESRSAVVMFVRSFPTSAYLRPALRWLRDHAEPQPTRTLLPQSLPASFPRFTTVIARGTELAQHPVEFARREVTAAPRAVELELQRFGDWLRVVNAANEDVGRFVSAADVSSDPAELPNFWTSDGIQDVSHCLDRETDSNCLLDRTELPQPLPKEVLIRILAVEADVLADPKDLPSAVAFNNAIDLQLELRSIGVPLRQTRLQVVPSSFAPELAGRVLLSISEN